jgi:hypothetical protein
MISDRLNKPYRQQAAAGNTGRDRSYANLPTQPSPTEIVTEIAITIALGRCRQRWSAAARLSHPLGLATTRVHAHAASGTMLPIRSLGGGVGPGLWPEASQIAFVLVSALYCSRASLGTQARLSDSCAATEPPPSSRSGPRCPLVSCNECCIWRYQSKLLTIIGPNAKRVPNGALASSPPSRQTVWLKCQRLPAVSDVFLFRALACRHHAQ